MEATQKLASTEADVKIDDAKSVRNALRVYLMEFGTFGEMNDFDMEFEASVNGTIEKFGISAALLENQTAILVGHTYRDPVGEEDFDAIYIVLEIDSYGGVAPRQLTYYNPGGRAYDVRQLL